MKRNIYFKLFKFSDIKSWAHIRNEYFTYFYKDYKLSFINENLCWYYRIDDNYTKEISGIITLNIIGRFLYCFILSVFIIVLRKIIFNDVSHILLDIIFSILSSYIIFLIFNWKIYLKLIYIRFYIYNSNRRKKIEENKDLEERFSKIINAAMIDNPKYSRKIKLDKIKKFK